MSAVQKPKLTPKEYLAIERAAEFKSEYYTGEMFAMSGASREHNLISGNVLAGLHRQFIGRDCEAYQGDMRVKVNPSGLYTYPAIVAVCGEPVFEDKEVDTLLSPTVLFEVLSESTEGYDRGVKFEHYRKIESLAEYILIAQESVHVEHFTRQSNHTWLLWETNSLKEILKIPAIDCELSIAEIYDKVGLTKSS